MCEYHQAVFCLCMCSRLRACFVSQPECRQCSRHRLCIERKEKSRVGDANTLDCMSSPPSSLLPITGFDAFLAPSSLAPTSHSLQTSPTPRVGNQLRAQTASGNALGNSLEDSLANLATNLSLERGSQASHQCVHTPISCP